MLTGTRTPTRAMVRETEQQQNGFILVEANNGESFSIYTNWNNMSYLATPAMIARGTFNVMVLCYCPAAVFFSNPSRSTEPQREAILRVLIRQLPRIPVLQNTQENSADRSCAMHLI